MIHFFFCVCAKSLRLCPTLCNPVDCSPPNSSVHGILQARILEWVAISFSRGIFPTQGSSPHHLHLLHWQATSSLPVPPGKHQVFSCFLQSVVSNCLKGKGIFQTSKQQNIGMHSFFYFLNIYIDV